MNDMQIGDMCWNASYADEMLTTIAQVGDNATSWFLATHSPITYRSENQDFQQEELFKRLINVKRRDYLVVVNGEPGSGKSQLINWLKLRYDTSIDEGQKNGFENLRLRSVLIRRRSGSLKDALEQLVDQLPELNAYLDKVRAAIDGVQGKEAGQRLCTEMFFSLQDQVGQAPKLLKKIHEIFLDPRAMEHMCRKGGAIDLNLKRLVEESDVNQRESIPAFSSDDFTFPISRPVKFDDELKERLEDDPSLRVQSAELATKGLRQAIAGLTGLKGHTLNELFRDIRAELARRGEALALFIEDVSTLSVLDEELVNALQPVNDPDLCPLISVLGMTLGAFDRLPSNLSQRIDMTLELSESSSFRSSDSDPIQVDKFVGRYLNALRLGESKIQMLADDIKGHDAIKHSACTDCIQKDSCFSAFGSVEIDEVSVGLYPMSSGSSIRLLNGLSDEKIPKTPRTLLQYIVLKLLKRRGSEWSGKTIGLEIKPRAPRDLREVEEQLLAKWTSDQRSRMSYLVYYWTGIKTIKDSVIQLDPKLAWWNLPPFELSSRKKLEKKELTSQSLTNETNIAFIKKPKAVTQIVDAVSKELTEAMGRLDQWYLQNEQLKNDATFRDLLIKVINKSVQLEEIRSPSNRVQRLANLRSSNVEIVGQVTRPSAASRVRFKFDRSNETYSLLRNLLEFKYSGNDSWDFSGGNSARRQYGLWLHNNLSRIISSFSFENSSKEFAVQIAVKFLHVAYRLCYRNDLSSDMGISVETLVSFAPIPNHCLTNDLGKLIDDLPARVQSIRDELLDELAVRQGTGGILYIDSRHIIKNISDVSFFDFSLASDTINKSEFPALAKLLINAEWSRLKEILVNERNALNEKINLIYSILKKWEISTEFLNLGVESFFKSSLLVIQALESSGQSLGNINLQKQVNDLLPEVIGHHANILSKAEALLEDEIDAILGFNMKDFMDSFSFMSNLDATLVTTSKSLDDRFSSVVTSSEVEISRKNALSAIELISTLLVDSTETNVSNK